MTLKRVTAVVLQGVVTFVQVFFQKAPSMSFFVLHVSPNSSWASPAVDVCVVMSPLYVLFYLLLELRKNSRLLLFFIKSEGDQDRASILFLQSVIVGQLLRA